MTLQNLHALIHVPVFLRQERQKKGEKDKDLFVAELLAYKGRFKEAARVYQRTGTEHRALAMYTDLRMFDLAQVKKCVYAVLFDK